MTNFEPRIGSIRFYSIGQVSALLGVHKQTVQQWITRGALEAFKVGGTWRITTRQLAVFLNKGRSGVKAGCDE